MKRLMLVMSMVLIGAMSSGGAAEARRLGGGTSSGMQRTAPAAAPKPPAQAPQAAPAPAQNAAPAAPAAVPPTAATPPKRSWMGPLAGLAAGFGLAALASHFGLGAGLGNMMVVLLVVMLGAVLIGFVMKFLANRRAPAYAGSQGMQFANEGSSDAAVPAQTPYSTPALSAGSSVGTASTASAVSSTGFDSTEFETIAKRVFIRLQAANDVGDLDDLRRFTTPEMFAVAKQELLDRGTTPQQTDIVQLQAAVVETAQEAGNQIVSVRFSGLIREEKNAPATPFDEVWHLVRPLDGSREWAIAGIQQTS